MRLLNQLPKKALLVLPLFAVLTIAGFVVTRTQPVGAQADPKQTRIEALTQKLIDAQANAQKNGEFTTDRHGEKVYAGKTAEDMKALERQVADEIRELRARPAAERQVTINAINAWNDKYLYGRVNGQPKQNVQYAGRPGKAETYTSEDYTFTVDVTTNRVLDVYMRPKEVGEPKAFEDMTPRFNETELEQKAVDLVNAQNLGVDLSKLSLEKGHKVGTYFFTWTSDGKTLQVAFTQGGQLISYTNQGF